MTGYSVGTISRVLNDQPNVSEKARRAVLNAVAETGFQPNDNARHLKQQHATSILVVVKGTSNELFSALVERIQSMISETSYPLLVDYIDEDSNEVRRAVRLCREKKPRGILFLGGNRENFVTDFHGISVPCVLVTNSAASFALPNLSSVTTDDRLAATKAIDCLVELGHRHIGVIGGCREVSDISRLRYEGCLDAMNAHGLNFDAARDYQGVRFSYQDGYRAAKALLASDPALTAVFAAADVMAIGAIRALQDAGLRVPEDISVMGFDGLAIGDYYWPRLTTVAQSAEHLARRGVELLLDRIENGGAARHETVPFAVTCKESVRRVSGADGRNVICGQAEF